MMPEPCVVTGTTNPGDKPKRRRASCAGSRELVDGFDSHPAR
jgi:hypothetical protein